MDIVNAGPLDFDPGRLRLVKAQKDDAALIARFYQMSSDGVADYIWSKLAEPGEELLDVGARRYARENTNFSYQNCRLYRTEEKVLGMLFAFPMHVDADTSESDPILRPYSELEQKNSYYISGVAIDPGYRGKGLGSQLMFAAEAAALRLNLPRLSLLVFEQNQGAFKFYKRLGYVEIGRRAVVPHPFLHFGGDAVLMSKATQPRSVLASWSHGDTTQ